ncbi:Pantothenate synthetase [Dyadobacter sp. CECT 9275]|uniref:Pantothenate synthetase n=1 Tax=Dyadobacter helix TaxID=2822344 RepID=A0A916NMJ3_9BACT|nr:pantoate--beta-alanine ligase [Dyadobacter sp. CECT 9275]CAG5007010.1 Pantothenate synthetase [Dyadobacter sp. CECT 9275]
MEVFTSVVSLRSYLQSQRALHHSIGLVPTMGALHEGHVSLIQTAVSENDIVVCSIFVNPVQFNNPDDLAKYPRTEEADLKILEQAGCSAAFVPSVTEMYPSTPKTTFNFGPVETVMEGKSRPGHFSGVGIVVARLFHIAQPDHAYFGQKDLQQVSVIRQLVTDLAFPVQLVVCPTVRETDGLAMSSRNRRLNEKQRHLAPKIYEALNRAKEQLQEGISTEEVSRNVADFFAGFPDFHLDYFEVSDAVSLQTIKTVDKKNKTALCIAIYLGEVRLIDNVVF